MGFELTHEDVERLTHDELLGFVRKRCREAFLHEFDENFIVAGKLFVDPHAAERERYALLKGARVCPKCKGPIRCDRVCCEVCVANVMEGRDPEAHREACKAWRRKRRAA